MSSFEVSYKIIPDDLTTHVDETLANAVARNPDSAVLEALTTVEKTTNLQNVPLPPITDLSSNADAS